METWDAITARRNVRLYTDEALQAGDLDRLLEAGRRTPSAFNSQPWDFVVVTDRHALEQLATVWRGAGHIGRSAATIAVVTPIADDPERARWYEFDLGQAVITMAITAADLGIGSAHAIIDDQARCRSLLQVPETHRGAYLLALGRPADRPLTPLASLNRRPFDDVVHRDHW